jgi:hypothetical protein
MFKLIGAVLALYIAQSVSRGEVLVKKGWRGERILRGENPGGFWLAITVYGLLCLALFTVF